MKQIWIGAKLALAIGIGAVATMAGQVVAAEDNPADWPSYYRDNSGWRYSPLRQITTENVKDLKVAWLHQPGDIEDGLQSTPIVVNGVIYYIAANNNVFAVNGKTGETIWHHQPKLDPMIKQTFWAMRNRGVTVGHGMVYIGTADGRYIAIDQKTGKERWQTQITDFKNCRGCNFSVAPQLAGDILYSGHTGGDSPISAKIYGVNALTGKLEWTFDVLKNDQKSWLRISGIVSGDFAGS